MIVLYRLLLRCYPTPFRLRFTDELCAAFEAGLRARWRRGLLPAASFAATSLADAVTSGFAERWADRRARGRETYPIIARDRRSWMQDLRFAFRTMRRQPAFSAVVISTLALGIGANTAVFSVVDTVLLRPLPYPDADRLVHVQTRNDALNISGGPASYPDFADWRAAHVFEEVGIYFLGNSVVRFGDASERVRSAAASASLFSTLGVQPAIGRLPLPEEDRPGPRPVVLLSHTLWRGRLASDPGILARTLIVDGKSLPIVGVLPEQFTFPGEPELWTTFEDDGDVTTRANRYLDVIGRVPRGLSRAQVNDRLNALCAQLGRLYADSNKDWRAAVVPWQESQVRDVRPQLLLLAGSVGLVLLITCTNVAMLLLVRGAARTKELAVRVALGAGRPRIVSQLLTESLVLSIAGGALGLGLAVWWVSLAARFGPREIPRLTEMAVNARVMLFALLTSCVAAVVFGLLPALQSSRPDVNTLLQETGRAATPGRRRRLLGDTLLIVETAISLVLIIGSALLVKSFVRLAEVDAGFRTDHLLTFRLPLPTAKFLIKGEYQPDRVRQFFGDVLSRLESRPDVVSAAATLELPLGGGGYRVWQGFEIAGRPDTGARKTLAVSNSVTPHFFSAMDIPLRKGRGLTERDNAAAMPVAVISDMFARTYLPGDDPLGQHVRFEGDRRWWEVVGVAGDVRPDGLDSTPNPVVYRSFAQDPKPFMAIVVRTRTDPAVVSAALAGELRTVDPDVPAYRLRTAEDLIARSLAHRRFGTTLMVAFAATALVLALVGLYAVISSLVAQSTREIGLRVALGATRGGVLVSVLGRALGPSAIGLLLGTVVAVLSAPAIRHLLYGVDPLDPLVMLAVPCTLAVACVLACAVPARRALRVDPVVALRAD